MVSLKIGSMFTRAGVVDGLIDQVSVFGEEREGPMDRSTGREIQKEKEAPKGRTRCSHW